MGRDLQPDEDAGQDRIDKWLCHARFFKTRTLAAGIVAKGRVRLNGQKGVKPGRAIRPGDVLTFPQGDRIRIVKILALADRRGTATQAQALFLDLAPESGTGVRTDDGPDRSAF